MGGEPAGALGVTETFLQKIFCPTNEEAYCVGSNLKVKGGRKNKILRSLSLDIFPIEMQDVFATGGEQRTLKKKRMIESLRIDFLQTKQTHKQQIKNKYTNGTVFKLVQKKI